MADSMTPLEIIDRLRDITTRTNNAIPGPYQLVEDTCVIVDPNSRELAEAWDIVPPADLVCTLDFFTEARTDVPWLLHLVHLCFDRIQDLEVDNALLRDSTGSSI